MTVNVEVASGDDDKGVKSQDLEVSGRLKPDQKYLCDIQKSCLNKPIQQIPGK